MYNLPQRPRRNRKSQVIRSLTQENQVNTSDLIFPLFLIEGKNKKSEIYLSFLSFVFVSLDGARFRV